MAGPVRLSDSDTVKRTHVEPSVEVEIETDACSRPVATSTR
jgi:hypothetical protein